MSEYLNYNKFLLDLVHVTLWEAMLCYQIGIGLRSVSNELPGLMRPFVVWVTSLVQSVPFVICSSPSCEKLLWGYLLLNLLCFVVSLYYVVANAISCTFGKASSAPEVALQNVRVVPHVAFCELCKLKPSGM